MLSPASPRTLERVRDPKLGNVVAVRRSNGSLHSVSC
jgi:hypothetical protein